MPKNLWMSSLAICLLAPVAAQAEYVLIHLDGTVTSVSNGDGLLPFGASVGDAMRISYVIDTIEPTDANVADGPLPEGWRWEGTYYGSVLSMSVSIGNQSFSFQSDVNDPHSSQQYSMEQYQGRLGGLYSEQWSLSAASAPAAVQYFAGASINGLSTSNIPLVSLNQYQPIPNLPEEDDYRSIYTSMFFRAGADQITGEFTRVSPVPIPAAVWLLLSGLGMLGIAPVRRSSASTMFPG